MLLKAYLALSVNSPFVLASPRKMLVQPSHKVLHLLFTTPALEESVQQ